MINELSAGVSRPRWGCLVSITGLLMLCCLQTQAQVVINEVMAANATAVANVGEYPDWIELYNTTAQSQNLEGMSLTDNPAVPAKYVLPAGTTIAAHGFLLVWCDHATTSPGLHTGFGLSAAGSTVDLHQSAVAGGGLLDSLTVGPQAQDYSVGRFPDGTGAFTLNVPTPATANQVKTPAAASGLVLNEWLASSSPGTVDWFELYNPATNPIALSGYVFSLQSSGPTNAALPTLSFIAPRQFVQFFADKLPTNGPTHLDFKLPAAGGTLTLFAPDRITVVESVTFGAQVRDVSQGYLPDGNRANVVSFPTTPTPGASNWLPLRNGVVINEVLAHTDPPWEDAIEFFNPTAQAIDLGGLYLSNTELDPKKFLVPTGTVVPAGGYAVLYEYQFNPSPGSATSFTFNSAHGDHAWLTEVDLAGVPTGYRIGVGFGASENGVSFGRYTTSVGDVFVPMSNRTFGVEAPATLAEFRTGQGAVNAYPKVGPIVISEVMYHPPDAVAGVDNVADEFIELRNLSASPVPLYDLAVPDDRWKLATAVDFTFPPNTVMSATGFALVVSFDPVTNATALAAFQSKYAVPSGVPVYGPYTGKLSNRAEDLQLLKPDAPQTPPHPDAGFVPYLLVDQLAYGATAPWPTNADGLGDSLQRVGATKFGNDPVNWVSAAPTAGRDNAVSAPVPPSISQSPASLEVVEGGNASFTVVATGDAPLSYGWRHGGQPLGGPGSATLLLTGVQPVDAGDYDVIVANLAGSSTSGVAHLTVHVPASILQAPTSLTVTQLSSATFTVKTAGDPLLAYQWRSSVTGGDVPGATNADLVLPSVHVADAGGYWVRVANTYGAATSAVASLTVLVPPAIDRAPEPVSAQVGDTVTLDVLASGTPPLQYAWRHDGAAVNGGTNAQLVLSSVTLADAGGYTVTVSNAAGSVTSVAVPVDVRSLTLRLDVLGLAGTNLVLRFAADAGRTYSLRYRTDLVAGDWTLLQALASTVTNRTIQVTDPVSLDSPGRFYRLESP